MSFHINRLRSAGSAAAASVTAVVLVSCFSTVTGPQQAPDFTLADLRITNQITGWTANGNPVNFVDSTITNLVDGGSSTYCGTCSHSTLKAGFQILMAKSQTPNQLKMFVIDYGTDANAKIEFNGMVQGSSWTTEDTLLPFSISDVFYTGNGNGVHAYSHFKNFYIELQFAGYDSSSQAVPDASAFMNYLHSKTAQ